MNKAQIRKDNYARNLCVIVCVSLFLFGVLIGLLSGFLICEIDDKVTENHRENLIAIYGEDVE